MAVQLTGNWSTSYLIPVGDLTLQERMQMRASADDAIITAAILSAIIDQASQGQMLVRDSLPFEDLGGTNGFPALATLADTWVDPNAGVVGTEHSYFSIALGLSTVPKVMGFFGLGQPGAVPNVARFRFGLNAGMTQVRGEYQSDILLSGLEPKGYFSEVVVFTRQEVVTCNVLPKNAYAANTEPITLMARTGEAIGNTVSAPTV